ncbi:unnamed protein product, partial [Phaeothamnion confervicola]
EALRRRLKEAEAGAASDARRRELATLGKWIPYRDKNGRGTFYYNTVSRASQWAVPPDYVVDRNYLVK